MSDQVWYIVLCLVGSFTTIALAINAFFLKGIYDRVGTVEISQAIIIENSHAKDKRLDDLEANQKEIFDRLNQVERERI